MSMRLVTATVAVTALVVLAVALTDLSFQRAILLAPVLVIDGQVIGNSSPEAAVARLREVLV